MPIWNRYLTADTRRDDAEAGIGCGMYRKTRVPDKRLMKKRVQNSSLGACRAQSGYASLCRRVWVCVRVKDANGTTCTFVHDATMSGRQYDFSRIAEPASYYFIKEKHEQPCR